MLLRRCPEENSTQTPFHLPIPDIPSHTPPMRHILTSVVLLVLLFPSLALGETMDDLVETNGLYFKKFTEVPFDGTVTGRFQGKIKDGKKDGPWVYYWSNGGLSSKGTYKNGKYVGPWVTYHKNGQLWFKKTY